MTRPLLTPLVLLAGLGCALPARAAPAVASGFAVERARALLGRAGSAFTCPPPVEPVVDLGGLQSRYDPKDPTQSRVSPERARHEAGRGRQLMAFVTGLARLADHAVASRPRNPQIGACATRQIALWARGDALLGNTGANDEVGRHQAIMTQAWQLAGIAAAMLKVAPGPGGADEAAAREWVGRLARSVMAEYRADNQWSRHGANHLYWAGLAVGLAGAVLQDPGMRDFALDALKRGLGDIDADGALKQEMARGPRSLYYQHFASLALVVLVRYAEANGAPLDPAQSAALARMLAFTAAQTRDSGKVQERTGAKQVPTMDRTSLAWIDPILPWARAHDPALAGTLEALLRDAAARPAWHVYLGGNASAVLNPEGSKP
jgi:poly(beta-D-mannuronate) lyase